MVQEQGPDRLLWTDKSCPDVPSSTLAGQPRNCHHHIETTLMPAPCTSKFLRQAAVAGNAVVKCRNFGLASRVLCVARLYVSIGCLLHMYCNLPFGLSCATRLCKMCPKKLSSVFFCNSTANSLYVGQRLTVGVDHVLYWDLRHKTDTLQSPVVWCNPAVASAGLAQATGCGAQPEGAVCTPADCRQGGGDSSGTLCARRRCSGPATGHTFVLLCMLNASPVRLKHRN